MKIPTARQFQDIQAENPNHPPHIAAHLQGTQSQHTKANLAKKLQLPTHGKQSFNSGRQNPQPPKEEEKKENRLTAVSFFILLLINWL